MEKYLAALVLSQQPTICSDVACPHSTMKSYLENVRKIKKQILNNLSICARSVIIQEQSQSTLKDCLIELASSSLYILSQIKGISSQNIIYDNTELFERKNSDYGNSFVDFELIGVIVRLNDKINRILNLGDVDPESMRVDEKIEDTINDLYNYCIIGLMYSL
tara:strand:- start:95 stop:583 length:489 start_codon:yes stop_codon:yes gene_type:complete